MGISLSLTQLNSLLRSSTHTLISRFIEVKPWEKEMRTLCFYRYNNVMA